MFNFNQRQKLKEAYKKFLPFILVYDGRISPHILDEYLGFDLHELLTPIEKNTWNNIRFHCLSMFPQFPVGKYFIDFADPIRKIGIEVDGKCHEKTQEKDTERQNELKKMGWTIYRISGRDSYMSCEDHRKENDDYDGDNKENYRFNENCGECQIKFIKNYYDNQF